MNRTTRPLYPWLASLPPPSAPLWHPVCEELGVFRRHGLAGKSRLFGKPLMSPGCLGPCLGHPLVTMGAQKYPYATHGFLAAQNCSSVWWCEGARRGVRGSCWVLNEKECEMRKDTGCAERWRGVNWREAAYNKVRWGVKRCERSKSLERCEGLCQRMSGAMRQRKLGSHTPPCHRRMVITTLFSVMLAALQRRPVLYHTRWLLTVHWLCSSEQ